MPRTNGYKGFYPGIVAIEIDDGDVWGLVTVVRARPQAHTAGDTICGLVV